MSEIDPPKEVPSSPQEFATIVKSRCIGLTGGIATGKSTVANILRKKGYLVIDADQLARQIVEPGEPALDAIVQQFGPSVLLPQGPNKPPELNREKLRTIVLANDLDRKALEAITHPSIHRKFKEIVDKSGISNLNQIFFYEAALIFEIGRDSLFYKTWATFCSPKVQIERLLTRSKLTQLEAEKLIGAQIPALEKSRMATLAIDTEVSQDELQSKINAALSAM